MKENYGAFNRSNYYFSLNRQNSKFQQKGLVFNLKKWKTKKTSTQAYEQMFQNNIYWTEKHLTCKNQMYLFLNFKNNQVLSLSSIAYFLIFATTWGPLP